MMINKFLDMLSPSGAEDKIRSFISTQLADKFDTTEVDNIGNLILRKSGTGKKLCIECGMDSRGIMIVSSENNKARFSTVGQLKANYLAGKKVLMLNGTIGIVRCDSEVSSSTKVSDLYLEIDTENISIGDFGTVYPDSLETSSNYNANGLFDIIGVAAVIEALLNSDTYPNLTVVFSAQKNLGYKGIRAFFGNNSFDSVFSICGCETAGGVTSGKGCAIIVKDKSAVASPVLKNELKTLAEKKGISTQSLVSDESYGMGFIAHGGEGNPCIALGIPVSHRDKTLESVNKGDFDSAVKLIGAIINE